MRGPRAGEATCRRPRPREEWIPIPVPAIIDEATHQAALAQLARNSVLNFRRNTRNSYLLRCLLVCRTCGLAMHGPTTRDKQGNLIQGYYRCHGKDPAARDREHRCPQSRVKVEELDAAVWAHICRLLDDPATLLAQFEALARTDAADAPGGPAGEDKAEAQLRRLDREGKRLLDAYQAEAIELAELRERQREIEGRRQVLIAQRDQQAQLREERRTARQVWGDLTAFCARIRSRLGEATAAERQQILQLLVERVIVGEDALEIRHVIPLRRLKPEPATPVPAGGGEDRAPARSSEEPPGAPEPRLRSDGVRPADLSSRHPVGGRPAVAGRDPRGPRAEQLLDHLPPAGERQVEDAEGGGHADPQPAQRARRLPAGLVQVGVVARQRLTQPRHHRSQHPAGLGLEGADLPDAQRHAEQVLEEPLGLGLAQVSHPGQGDRGGLPPGAVAVGRDLVGHPSDRGVAVGTGERGEAVFGDLRSDLGQFPDRVAAGRLVRPAERDAADAAEAWLVLDDAVGSPRRPHGPGVAGLAARLAARGGAGRGGLGVGEVGGGRLVGVGGVGLPSGLQLGDAGLQLLDPGPLEFEGGGQGVADVLRDA
jgi:hypothetical protein